MMETVYVVLTVLLVGLMMTGIFTLGALFAVRLTSDAHEQNQYDRLREEYYRMAGYRHAGDPKPYFPTRQAAQYTQKVLPGMSALDRLMKQGKRGTIMWRPEDRQQKE